MSELPTVPIQTRSARSFPEPPSTCRYSGNTLGGYPVEEHTEFEKRILRRFDFPSTNDAIGVAGVIIRAGFSIARYERTLQKDDLTEANRAHLSRLIGSATTHATARLCSASSESVSSASFVSSVAGIVNTVPWTELTDIPVPFITSTVPPEEGERPHNVDFYFQSREISLAETA